MKQMSKIDYVKLMPILLRANGWQTVIPENLKETIYKKRLQHINDEDFLEKAHEFELLPYLMTLSFEVPLGDDGFKIYMYLSNKFFSDMGRDIPECIKTHENISNYLLNNLNSMLIRAREKQVKHAKEIFKNIQKKQQANLNSF